MHAHARVAPITMTQPTGDRETAVAGLIQAAEQRLQKIIADTTVYPETSIRHPPSPGVVSSANGHGPKERAARGHEDEDPEQLCRHLGVLLLQCACDVVESQAAELRAESRIRLIRLWSSLCTSLAVLAVCLVWLGWEAAHPPYSAHLILLIAGTVLNGGWGAFAVRGWRRRKPNQPP